MTQSSFLDLVKGTDLRRTFCAWIPILNVQNMDEGGNHTHPDCEGDLAAVAPLKYGSFANRFF